MTTHTVLDPAAAIYRGNARWPLVNNAAVHIMKQYFALRNIKYFSELRVLAAKETTIFSVFLASKNYM